MKGGACEGRGGEIDRAGKLEMSVYCHLDMKEWGFSLLPR